MTADAVIADWVPWSTGDAARYRTKAEAVVDLRYRLREAGFVIVPRVATEAMLDALNEMAQCEGFVPEGYAAMIKESQR